MKRIYGVIMMVLMAFIASSGAYAQEWNKAQTEVWQVVTNSWNAYQNANIDQVMAVIHPKYQGWDNLTPLPYSKEKSRQQISDWFKIKKLEYYDIEPARITVLDNAAVVDYYYAYSSVNLLGEKKESKERKGITTEFYVKEGGKWLLLGDMTAVKEQ